MFIIEIRNQDGLLGHLEFSVQNDVTANRALKVIGNEVRKLDGKADEENVYLPLAKKLLHKHPSIFTNVELFTVHEFYLDTKD